MKPCSFVRGATNHLLGCIAIATLAEMCNAQTAQPIQPPANGVSATAVSDYAITQAGPDSVVWRNSAGQTVTSLATGMNYSPDGGQTWLPSDNSFAVSPDGSSFIASRLRDPTTLAANINSQGSVSAVTPEGVTLRSTPTAIVLYDSASGLSAIVGTITNSIGVQVDAQHVVYTNAFSSSLFSASIVYSLPDTGSFHQDVIFTGFDTNFDPTAFGFAAGAASTLQIEVMTEFYNPAQPMAQERDLYIEPDPNVRAGMASPDVIDYTLDFGHYVFGPGRAYTTSSSPGAGAGVVVTKDFVTTNGRSFLIESTSLKSIAGYLNSLPAPKPTASLNPPQSARKRMVAWEGIPSLKKNAPRAKVMKVAGLMPSGVDVDYIATVSSTVVPKLYSSDTTYFVSGNVYESSAVTMEAAVFKYPTNAGRIEIASTLTLATTNYRTAIFTSADDDTAGASLTNIYPGYTGTPTSHRYGNQALLFDTSASTITLNNLRFCYLNIAVQMNADMAGQTLTMWHSQFVDCYEGVYVDGGNGSNTNDSLTFNLYNCLFTDVGTSFEIGAINITVNAYNCTDDSSTDLVTVDSGSTVTGNVRFTNSIFSTLTSKGTLGSSLSLGGGSNAFYNCGSATFGTFNTLANSPYVTNGAGSFYITNYISYLTNGSTSIPAALLSQLEMKTTQAPSFLTNFITTGETLIPIAQRDTNGISLGFHYNPIDYLSSFSISNVTVSLSDGIVLAYYQNPGIALLSGSILTGQGAPNQRNYLVYYNLVQEQPVRIGTQTNALTQALPIQMPAYAIGLVKPVIDLRLTTICAPMGETNIWMTGDTSQVIGSATFRDCEVYGSGAIWQMSESTNMPLLILTNDVFYRVPFAVTNNGTNSVFNTLFYGTTNTNEVTVAITNRSLPSQNRYFNNVFDGVLATIGTNAGYNAYIHGAANTGGTNGSELMPSITWQSGPLGSFYQTNSVLVHAGSTYASNLGFFHYTVLTNETIEGTNIVSIGYHYVAVDSNALPLISNTTNPVPDYLADANGNGVIDPGEVPWYNSPSIVTNPYLSGLSNIIGLVATGTPQLSYLWQSNGVAISPQQTNTTYTASGPGHYTAQVSNVYGTIVSDGVDIVDFPTATTIVANPGDEALMSAPTGSSGWQWQFNGVNICDATSSNLTIAHVDATNAGTYTVLYNSSSSSSITLETGPEIIVQPQDSITSYGGTATFSVTAIGSSFTYQWQSNYVDITNATNSTLTITNATQSNAGSYTVILTSLLTNSPYSTISYFALLGVTEPIISVSNPFYKVGPGTNTISFPVSVTGSPGMTYQWYKQVRTNSSGAWNSILLTNGAVNTYVNASVSGAETTNLTLSNSGGLTGADSGVYRLSATATTGDTRVSPEINLYVDPAITNQPQNLVVDVGSNATFTVGAWSTGTLSYQWSSNGSPVAGATKSSFTISATANTAVTNTVAVTSTTTGTVTSSNVNGILLVRTPIWITTNQSHGNLTNNFNFATTNGNGSTTNWYCASNSALYTAILTSSIPHIVHYDAGTFQTTGEETWNYNTAQPGWQHWGHITGGVVDTTIQMVCNSSNSTYNTIFGSGSPAGGSMRVDGFQLHDLVLDCNANGQTQRQGTNSSIIGSWTGVDFICGNNVLLSNITFIHFGKQGDIENFPFAYIPYEVLDENDHLITLYSNVTVEDCVFTNPGTNNGSSVGGVTVGSILPSFGQQVGDWHVLLDLTNAGFSNCTISNVQSDFGWTNGFTAISVQNCFISGCGAAVYLEIGNPVYYGQSFLIQSNTFTNVQFGLLANYNEVSQYPTALGNITFTYNNVWLDTNQPRYPNAPYEGGIVVQAPNNEAAISQIPMLTIQSNQITTGNQGYAVWGFFLGNTATALITDNTIDTSYYGLSFWDAHTTEITDDNALRMPLSYLSAARNRNGSQLVDITPWGTTSTLPSIGTQLKGDFFLSGSQSLIWQNTSSGQNMFWPMNGTNTLNTCGPLVSNWLPPMPTGWTVAGTADFTGDCNNDILWTMPGTTNVLLWTMMGPSFVTSNWMTQLGVDSSFGIAGTGDFNGDGKTDLLITNFNSTKIRLMNGTQIIQDVTLTHASPSSHAQIVGVGDVTGTGQADIFWRDYTTGTNYIWLMNGTSWSYTSNFWSEPDTNWQIQAVGDFDGNGIADLLWRDVTTGSNRLWLTRKPWYSAAFTNVALPMLPNLDWTIGGPK